MTGKKITFYILAAFIAGTLLLIYIQFNSAKNISTLITGNEKLLAEFKISHELKELESDIFSVESKTRGTIVNSDSSQLHELEDKIEEVESDIRQLQKISDNDITVQYIDALDKLIQKKLHFSRHLVDSIHQSGKTPGTAVASAQTEKEITDSIVGIVQMIDSTRQMLHERVTISIDKSGKRAQQLSNILIVLMLVSGAGLFWYIINIIRKQLLLIQQLNISEKKVKESAQIKENFMANMSHEIRTPMNAILGFTNLLQRKKLDTEATEYVQTIQQSGEGLLTIINDILDLSKIEAGMVRIESAPFSIREVVRSVEVMFKPKASEKELQFFVDVDESLPEMVEGDAARLTQILVNLAGNAFKFTDRGSISIRIINKGRTEQIIHTGITVADTGIGVEKETLQRIFERFQQAEDSVTRKYGGTGLGLSIVKDLVQLQNGSIDVESEPGKGTCFKLNIPFKITEVHPLDLLSENAASAVETNFSNTVVLVVEDNEINQSLLKHLFKQWQLNYDLANNGKEAIAKLRQKKYDLILMDIQMPEMDGYTATYEIRNQLNLQTPVIAMTAHVLANEREKCLNYGMNEYIAKPIREKELLQLITQFTSFAHTRLYQKGSVGTMHNSRYKFIDLQYMKEVSNGNKEYEKTVTEQFIDALPADLNDVEKAWQQNDIKQVKQLAHNMKTTVSVMGLNKLVQTNLDALEHEQLTEQTFQSNFLSLQSVCEASIEEAKHFFSSL